MCGCVRMTVYMAMVGCVRDCVAADVVMVVCVTGCERQRLHVAVFQAATVGDWCVCLCVL